MSNPGPIEDAAQLEQALAVLTPMERLAIDTEFLWERTYYPKLALLQVAGRDEAGEIVEFQLFVRGQPRNSLRRSENQD